MTKEVEKFYITTSIAYTNAQPHIGFALESIQADVIARYEESLGKDVWFLTGTDEHGIKIAKTAAEDSKTPKEFTDKIAKRYIELTKKLNLSNKDFIRTTDKIKHWPSVEKVWKKLKDNGDIEARDYEGYYCVGCEAFITERTKDSLVGGCSLHPTSKLIEVKEKNYFFKLSKYASKIKKAIETNEMQIIPETRKNEVISIINEGLKDISFSRSVKKLDWGIPVPGDPDQTIYVWADALTNYISAIGYENESKQFKKYWPADIHCIGKDILRFHALIWPGILLSLGLDLPKKIFVHGFVLSDGQKMSKSIGNVIDPFELLNKYGTDPVRYFFLREITPFQDGDFTIEKFEERYNSDLAKGLGNLLSRVLKLAEEQDESLNIENQELKIQVDKTETDYKEALNNFKFDIALKSIWELIGFCDKYIEKEKPWEDKENKLSVINDLLLAISKIAEFLALFLPETSEKIFEQLKTKESKSLFPRID
ncbi:MAG: methionine--tRNA ligase [Patescibacteria group bacterium]|nr:methionine--tRNA ligase [Patescibacteria group bacterium]